MKKIYMQPSMEAYKVQNSQMICESPSVEISNTDYDGTVYSKSDINFVDDFLDGQDDFTLPSIPTIQ